MAILTSFLLSLLATENLRNHFSLRILTFNCTFWRNFASVKKKTLILLLATYCEPTTAVIPGPGRCFLSFFFLRVPPGRCGEHQENVETRRILCSLPYSIWRSREFSGLRRGNREREGEGEEEGGEGLGYEALLAHSDGGRHGKRQCSRTYRHHRLQGCCCCCRCSCQRNHGLG